MVSITFVSGNTCLFAWNILQTLISLGIGLFFPMFKKKKVMIIFSTFFTFFFFTLNVLSFQMRRVHRWNNGKRRLSRK